MKDIVKPSTWEAMLSFCYSNKMNGAHFGRLRPWWAGLQVQQQSLGRMGVLPQFGIESYFSALASKDGKTASSLEPAKDQIMVFANLSAEDQEEFLVSSLANQSLLHDFQVRLRSTWRMGDVPGMISIFQREESDDSLRAALIVARHKQWVSRLLSRRGLAYPTLVIVGSRHLVDPRDNLLKHFHRNGFTIERVVQ